MRDPVYIISIKPGYPMRALIVPRETSEFLVSSFGVNLIKVAEIDTDLKSEYQEYLAKAK